MDSNPSQPQIIISSLPFYKNPKIIITLAVSIVLFLLVIAFYLLNRGGLNLKNLFRYNPLIVSVTDQKIYLDEIKWESGADDDNKEALKETLARLIERKILDITAAKSGIQVTNQELKEKMNLATTSAFPKRRLLTRTKYQMLKDKIIAQNIASRQAYIIGFWISPYNWPEEFSAEEKKLHEQQRTQGSKALAEIETRLSKGEEPYQIGKSLYEKYQVLQSILAINGFKIQHIQDQTLFSRPRLFTSKDKIAGNIFTDTLFKMKRNEVKKIEMEDGSGGSVIKVISIQSGEFETYEDWLNQQKKKLVVYHKAL